MPNRNRPPAQRSAALAILLVLGWVPLAIGGCDDSPAELDSDSTRTTILAFSGDPCPGWIANVLPTCRTVVGDTLAALESTLADPGLMRSEDDNCNDVIQTASSMLNNGDVYMAHHDTIVEYLGGSGGGMHLADTVLDLGAIILGQVNFYNLTSGDPFDTLRAETFLHEASHDLGYKNCDQVGPGTPCAETIASFCSKRPGGTDPWTDIQETTGGGQEDPCEEMFFCEEGCWVALFDWVGGDWTQVSEPWWDEDCSY